MIRRRLMALPAVLLAIAAVAGEAWGASIPPRAAVPRPGAPWVDAGTPSTCAVARRPSTRHDGRGKSVMANEPIR
jgi:hypothetical protein